MLNGKLDTYRSRAVFIEALIQRFENGAHIPAREGVIDPNR